MNTNGAISFLMPVGQYTPDPFPLGDGRRLVAPFWADVDTTINHGSVYYRQTTNADILERASQDIRGAFIDQPRFYATWVFVSTWYQVTYYGGNAFTNVSTNFTVLWNLVCRNIGCSDQARSHAWGSDR